MLSNLRQKQSKQLHGLLCISSSRPVVRCYLAIWCVAVKSFTRALVALSEWTAADKQYRLVPWGGSSRLSGLRCPGQHQDRQFQESRRPGLPPVSGVLWRRAALCSRSSSPLIPVDQRSVMRDRMNNPLISLVEVLKKWIKFISHLQKIALHFDMRMIRLVVE